MLAVLASCLAHCKSKRGGSDDPALSDAHWCTVLGCSSSENLVFEIPREQVHSGELEFCRNTTCWRSHLRVNIAAGELSLEPALKSRYDFVPVSMDWRATVVRFTAHTQPLPFAEVLAGDVLKAELTDSARKVLFSVSATVHAVSDTYPNGRDCDINPCRSAIVDLTDASAAAVP
ncbi:MAG: hypothetical protein ABW061_18210 [Polyangiaceae bacterium]